MNRSILLILLAVALPPITENPNLYAEDPGWKNPAERYLQAHEAYADASCPISEDGIDHFVYFARDRESLQNHLLLDHDRFAGAQIMYSWATLEPERGVYDFSQIEEDIAYLRPHGKRLWVQLQDATFSPKYRGSPTYLNTAEFDGGEVPQYTESGQHEGWVAKRWNPEVRERFAHLLQALGQAFDGQLAGINLQETAIGVAVADPSFSPADYVEAVKANMTALKEAFPTSATMQYANFMPGEWLPWEDEGYLRSIYAHGEAIGVGLGAPDLMPRRKGQLNHALALMHEGAFTAPLGIAVQDGNYVGATGADFAPGEFPSDPEGVDPNARDNLVPILHAFAKDFLKVDIMFWVNQEPYFETDVAPCFEE